VGVPILTGPNPPLKRLCEEYKVGVSTDDIKEGIFLLDNNIDKYRKNVTHYIEKIDYEKRIDNLCGAINELIKK